MNYLALECSVDPPIPFIDLLSYYLAEAGFSMFENEEDKLTAWISEEEYDEQKALEALALCEEAGCRIRHELKVVAKQNWNEEWEKSYPPELVDGLIYIYADFHPPSDSYPYSIRIQPQMSFGTGHHPTTRMMLRLMLGSSFDDKEVLDMGCGTGILAIFARIKGATPVTAVEIEPDAVANALENCLRNGHPDIRVQQASKVPAGKYDYILANINRSILAEQMPDYVKNLNPGGQLFVSGFYEDDLSLIQKSAEQYGLTRVQSISEDQWAAAIFKR